MKLMHNDYSFRIDFRDGFVYSLTIENNKVFAELVTEFYEQTENEKGKFILGDEFAPISLSKNTELITQFIPFDCCRKTLVTKLYNFLKKEAVNSDMYSRTQSLFLEIIQYISQLIRNSDISAEYLTEPDLTAVFKSVDLKPCGNGGTLAEKIIDYFLVCYELEGEKLFVTVNLKTYLDDEQLSHFVRSIVSHKIKLLMIENTFRNPQENEKIFIIDKDLCEIY